MRSLIKLGVAIYILYSSYNEYFQGTLGHSYMSVIGRWKSNTFHNSYSFFTLKAIKIFLKIKRVYMKPKSVFATRKKTRDVLTDM